MASKHPNPNLWAVSFSVDGTTDAFDTYWICAATMQSAIAKAKGVAKRIGLKRVRITKVKWEGTIDAF